jgi:hypothetical protein
LTPISGWHLWGRHIHSERAQEWLEKFPEEKFFFCRFKQLTVLRLLTSAAVVGSRHSPTPSVRLRADRADILLFPNNGNRKLWPRIGQNLSSERRGVPPTSLVMGRSLKPQGTNRRRPMSTRKGVRPRPRAIRQH